jgi:HK97 family phage portal protein
MGLLSLFKRKPEQKESRVVRLHVGGGGGLVQADKDYDKFSRETYLKNVIAYRCIHDIAQACAEPRCELHRDIGNGNTELVTDHEINDLIKRPSPDSSWAKLIYRMAAFLAMTGNTFPERVKLQTRASAYPSELYCLRPDRIKIIMNDNTGRIKQYKYSTNAGSEYFDVDPITGDCDLLHISFFHPTDDFWGASPIEPASRDIDAHNDATDWNLAMIRNQGRPGMVFTLVGDVSDDDFDRIEKQIDQKFSGPQNAGRPIILTGDNGTKAEPYTLKPSDMEWTEGNRELARKIALSFGEPPMLLGIPGDNTYSNQKEARLAFYEGTVSFYLNFIYSELNHWTFQSKDKLMFKYIIDDLPAMEPRWESRWKRATEADFLTLNEKREMTGYEKIDDGDVIFVPATMVPLSMAVSETDNNLEEQAKKITLSDEEYDIIMGINEGN